ncbi:MAG: Uma2 family endonuclease [Candidatus Schekmanbacteria bacterium]|nr:Uma2 family endonuclease [Candidatus Schekmanbacteria bacterium]
MGQAATRRYGYAEYLIVEHDTGTRHEYLDGQTWAMAGGTPRHSAIKSNLQALFRNALHGTPCRPYDSDLKIRVLKTGLATYPDLAVLCGRLETHPEDPNAVTNPVLLGEVLSDDTEAWDRGGKFAHFRCITSLRHYLLLPQDSERIESYTRQEDGSWRLTEHFSGDVVGLEALGVELHVDLVYQDLPST